jgi:hypothetical protein
VPSLVVEDEGNLRDANSAVIPSRTEVENRVVTTLLGDAAIGGEEVD